MLFPRPCWRLLCAVHTVGHGLSPPLNFANVHFQGWLKKLFSHSCTVGQKQWSNNMKKEFYMLVIFCFWHTFERFRTKVLSSKFCLCIYDPVLKGNLQAAVLLWYVMAANQCPVTLLSPNRYRYRKKRFLSGSLNPNNISGTVLFLPCVFSFPACCKNTENSPKNVVLSASISPLSITRDRLAVTLVSVRVCS